MDFRCVKTDVNDIRQLLSLNHCITIIFYNLFGGINFALMHTLTSGAIDRRTNRSIWICLLLFQGKNLLLIDL